MVYLRRQLHVLASLYLHIFSLIIMFIKQSGWSGCFAELHTKNLAFQLQSWECGLGGLEHGYFPDNVFYLLSVSFAQKKNIYIYG